MLICVVFTIIVGDIQIIYDPDCCITTHNIPINLNSDSTLCFICASTSQAQTKEVREMWTSEIRRLLEAQFTLMKGQLL